VGYLLHKASVGEQSTRNLPGLPGWLRALYLAILFPHLILALVMLPMIFLTFRRAIRRDWPGHPRMGRPTLAVWIFVSVTGVAVYAMLYHVFQALRG
jgi:putative membrane protein